MKKEQNTTDPRFKKRQPPLPMQSQPPTAQERLMDPAPDYGLNHYKGYGRLKDRIALITGADSGIGRAVALAFAREGAHIVINYLENETDAKETEHAVTDAGVSALLLQADISTDNNCRDIVNKISANYGRIDILVNNAAIQGKAVQRFEDLDAVRVEKTFHTNIISMFHLVRHSLAYMHPGGVIINTASIQAYQPSGSILDYAVTKGAIVTFTKGLSQLLIQRGIRVNCVAPGPVWTPLIVQSFDASKVAKFGENTPIGRPAQPAELAPAFVFLACDESSYIHGEILGVTGGRPLS